MMLYSEILVFKREGDKVVPYRASVAWGWREGKYARIHRRATSYKELSWASLYGGHTEWIARDIEERANAPRRRYA